MTIVCLRWLLSRSQKNQFPHEYTGISIGLYIFTLFCELIVPGSLALGSLALGSLVPGSLVPGSFVPGSLVPGSLALGSLSY
tara:strand:+ start:232 stop:477 length:246 start_codon:yes stop_codon:yes gene_type:complete